ncbi:MAG: hypothetical protein LQ337_007214 [Flavoplaca oasis]|nr:MAG: hypothetical protein LQ337_007214 [Flavoplaca oasis]
MPSSSSPEETSPKKSRRGRPRKGARSHAQTSSVIDPRPDVPTNRQNAQCQSQPSILCDAVDQSIKALNRGASLFFNTTRDVVDRAQHQTNLPPSPANPGPSTRDIVRCVLATDDNIRINQLTPKDIVDAFEAEGGFWKHVAATRREHRSLRLFLDSSEVKNDIEMRVTEIPRILGLPGRCKSLRDVYLVKARRFQLRKTTLPEPNDRISAWSKRNNTQIIKASWRGGKLILAMANLEDALMLCERRQVYLDGQVGEVV